MQRKKLIPILIVSVLAFAAAFGAFTYSSVYAQDATPTPENSTTPARPGQGKEFRGGVTGEGLATALGITTEELETAYQAAAAEALNQAVEAGLITQEQADQYAADGLLRRHFRILHNSDIDYQSLLAEALGITTGELQAAQLQAFNAAIDQAVADGVLTQEKADLLKGRRALHASETFQASMNSAYEEAVNQAVSDGVITQAQADQLLENAAGKNLFGRMGLGKFIGRHGMRGGDIPADPAGGDQ
jgi:ribosomal protein S20